MKTKVIFILIIILAVFLRLYHLGTNPPSLYGDETSLGYNAYSISQTLRDEHGEFLPYSRFIAFGDYKPPLYIYAAALSVHVLGLNEFTVRLPSALSGAALCAAAFFLVQQLLKKNRQRTKVALLSSLIICISPWSLQISRVAFEANLATSLMCFGFVFLLKFLGNYKFKFLILSSLFLVSPIYTFNSHRIVIPLLVGLILILNIRRFVPWDKIIIFIFALLVLVAPAVPHIISQEGRLRFQEVAWINDLAPIVLSNSRVEKDNNSLLGKILHNRRLVYSQEFLFHFADNFKPDYLFLKGDQNPKLSIQKVGEFYWLDLPFLIFGIFYLLRRRDKISFVFFLWILVGLIPASLARETPHALRTSPILPIPQIIIALGIVFLTNWIPQKLKKWFVLCLTILITVGLANYLSLYHTWYPQKYSSDWQFGYKQMVVKVNKLLPYYKGAVVTEGLGRPYIYFLFYSQTPPQEYWSTVKTDRDWFGFWTVHSVGNIFFGDYDKPDVGWIYVRPAGKSPSKSKIIEKINDLSGHETFEISVK